MDTALEITGWVVFGIAVITGLLLDVVGLFGNWIILLAVGIAGLLSGFDHFGGWTIPALLILAIAGEVIEAVASGVGAARFGGSKGTITAAVVGCILGAIAGSPILPIIGTLAGACAGAFVGAALYEYLMMEKQVHTAMYVGFGAALGKVAGIFMKAFVGLAMVSIALWRL